MNEMITEKHAEFSRNRFKKGSTLLLVMGICMVLMITGISLTKMTNQASFMARHQHDWAQSLAVAEAGVSDMISKMTADYDAWYNGATVTTVYGGGSNVVTTSTNSGGNVIIRSTGYVNDVEREVILELLGTVVDVNDRLWAFGNGLLADGVVIMETGAPEINGDAHANGNFNLINGTINGDLSSAGTITNAHGTISGSSSPSVDPVTIPTFDFDAYKASAESGGLYYSNSVTLSGTISPPNGILYVNGNVQFANNTTVNGVIVASGDVTIRNRLVQNQVDGLPAVLSLGMVYLHNRNLYNGSVYGQLGVDTFNNRQVNGSVISQGPVNIRNRLVVNAPSDPPAWNPDDTGGTPEIVYGGWLK